MGIKTRQPSSKIIVFDWDDTICPSTYVDRHQIDRVDKMPEHIQNLFADVARYAAHCLREASKYGEVIIITNSDEGWVHYSCEKFVPCLLPLIKGMDIVIVSARTAYEKFYPGQPLCWKAAAFAHEVNEYFKNSCIAADENDDVNTSSGSLESEESFDSNCSRESNGQREIISFGDSTEERTAVKIVSDQLSAVPKSVMFVASPSPVQIIGQLQLLTQHMRYICTHPDRLDLEITSEQAQRFAEMYIRRSKPDLRQAKDLSAMMATLSPESMCAGS